MDRSVCCTMSIKQRAWWPAVPYGCQPQNSEVQQHDSRTAAYWNVIQQDLSRAMPWAVSEHIQAQKTSPPSESWSAQYVQRGHQSKGSSSIQSQHAASRQKQVPIDGNDSSTGPGMLRQAAQSCTPSEPESAPSLSQTSPAARLHTLYAALFLVPEQQRALLDR